MLDSNTEKTFELINSKSLSAQENMDIDRDLFLNFRSQDMPIFRVYQWEESYTYGISQDIKKIKDLRDLKRYNQNHAQRITGGGILFHGNDISYSLVIPISYVKNLSVKKSYELICEFLISFYKSLGLHPIYAKDLEDTELLKSNFCQEGFEPYDILIDGKKIGGNAQRRSKSVIFQHGSISIDNSAYSIGHSLEDLGIKIGFKEGKDLLKKAFAKTFNVVFKNPHQEISYAS